MKQPEYSWQNVTLPTLKEVAALDAQEIENADESIRRYCKILALLHGTTEEQIELLSLKKLEQAIHEMKRFLSTANKVKTVGRFRIGWQVFVFDANIQQRLTLSAFKKLGEAGPENIYDAMPDVLATFYRPKRRLFIARYTKHEDRVALFREKAPAHVVLGMSEYFELLGPELAKIVFEKTYNDLLFFKKEVEEAVNEKARKN